MTSSGNFIGSQRSAKALIVEGKFDHEQHGRFAHAARRDNNRVWFPAPFRLTFN